MVKGISRQVIVVQSPDKKLFEQAIFILNDSVVNKDAITDDMLLKEARMAIRSETGGHKRKLLLFGPVWACGGALLTGIVWLLSVLF